MRKLYFGLALSLVCVVVFFKSCNYIEPGTEFLDTSLGHGMVIENGYHPPWADKLTFGSVLGLFIGIILIQSWIRSLIGETSSNVSLQNSDSIKAVLVFLEQNPWSGRAAVANGVGLAPKDVSSLFQVLKKDGRIESSGKGARTVYIVEGRQVNAKKVLGYLEKNPWSQRSAISEGLDLEATSVGVELRALKKARQIQSCDNKSPLQYAVYGEKTEKPVS